jgi:23S rRNA (guanosine2251-2'-O)-methyltransferase
MNNDFIYGIRSTIEAVNSGKEINKVLVQRGLQGELFSELQKLLTAHSVPCQSVPYQKLNKLTKNNHQGVIAFVAPIGYNDLEETVEMLLAKKKNPLFLILDRVTDVRNFGSIARSAECLGADAIIIPKRGAAQVTSDAIKTSAGALTKITVCREDNLRDTLILLKQYEVMIAGCSEKAEKSIVDHDLTKPLAIVLGSEENGISKEIYKRCDVNFNIPMYGEISSMNVAVTCGIVLYEVNRQRNA